MSFSSTLLFRCFLSMLLIKVCTSGLQRGYKKALPEQPSLRQNYVQRFLALQPQYEAASDAADAPALFQRLLLLLNALPNTITAKKSRPPNTRTLTRLIIRSSRIA